MTNIPASGRFRCPQCGQAYKALACGPTHAIIATQVRQAPDLERLVLEARAEVERLREEVADQHTLIQRQGDLLTGAVNALRGEPPELTWWSHHDVAERAAGLVAELAAERAKVERVAELADFFQGRLPDGTGNGRAYNSYRVAEFIRAALTGGEQG